MSGFQGKQAYMDTEAVLLTPSDTLKIVVDYMKNDKTRKSAGRIFGLEPERVKSYTVHVYTDGDYWWTDLNLINIQEMRGRFADGFIDHVLRRLKKDGEG